MRSRISVDELFTHLFADLAKDHPVVIRAKESILDIASKELTLELSRELTIKQQQEVSKLTKPDAIFEYLIAQFSKDALLQKVNAVLTRTVTDFLAFYSKFE